MDVLSHGLWGLAISRHKLRWWVAISSGAVGDVIAFLPARIQELLAGTLNFKHEVRPLEDYPTVTQHLYNATHSILGLLLVFTLLWLTLKVSPSLIRRLQRPGNEPCSAAHLALWITIPWALHVAMDIPLHTIDFFPTPVLWPLSSWRFGGIEWAQAAVIVPNVLLLSVALWWSWWRLRRQEVEIAQK
jgi:hypothetical protein